MTYRCVIRMQVIGIWRVSCVQGIYVFESELEADIPCGGMFPSRPEGTHFPVGRDQGRATGNPPFVGPQTNFM